VDGGVMVAYWWLWGCCTIFHLVHCQVVTLSKLLCTCASVGKQYNLILFKGRWRYLAGEVTNRKPGGKYWQLTTRCMTIVTCGLTAYRDRDQFQTEHLYWVFVIFTFLNKKFELMLTRCVKAYGSSCSQTVTLSPAVSSQFILRVCTAAADHKHQ